MRLYRAEYLLIVFAFTLILVNTPVSVKGQSADTIVAAEGISLSVDFGNGTVIQFDDLNGSNVLDVTQAQLDVVVQWYGPLAYVREIEGIAGQGQFGWQYWVNGEYASIAVNLFTLIDGDAIEWVYSGRVAQSQEDPTLIPGAMVVAVSGFGFMAIVYIQTTRRLK
ncbi:MAG: DUF4430 domain-containing protein [Promethearchaeota archaeon]